MSTTEQKWGSGVNAEAIAAWDGPLFDRFVQFRYVCTTGVGPHCEAALRRLAPQPGQRELDVGCGFGATTLRIAGIVGSEGKAVGVDGAARFIEVARADTAEAVAHLHGDADAALPEGLNELATDEGVIAPASRRVVTGLSPGASPGYGIHRVS
jgi:SAM-dependent methyltransferase